MHTIEKRAFYLSSELMLGQSRHIIAARSGNRANDDFLTPTALGFDPYRHARESEHPDQRAKFRVVSPSFPLSRA
ncbi:MAG: hypothetical protein JOZ58_10215 [Acetobacteraceae bacterium]|nr:hypothetical protein [Acetobacteraceae bacterium]